MAWFIKTETFRLPADAVIPHLQEHRRWVERLRLEGLRISSGYLVDDQGRPGGGGLLLLEAVDHDAALALVLQDPMVLADCVHWQLQGWRPAVGDLAVS
ncbi:YciI family protein [Aphanothece minutissima]|uniref:YCII-related domain-containing protein n=1 Tax=Aphanothece cf. minutissima CCALA 015 TaxID=2107695 RepID=A0ABX5F7S3_9CHRO|nr:YciI family protein [Aphanothece minutissima]PSB37657.1 hypothetical protein C7B81_09140 [Aphanothece cf. minutissima CCALA 015]